MLSVGGACGTRCSLQLNLTGIVCGTAMPCRSNLSGGSDLGRHLRVDWLDCRVPGADTRATGSFVLLAMTLLSVLQIYKQIAPSWFPVDEPPIKIRKVEEHRKTSLAKSENN